MPKRRHLPAALRESSILAFLERHGEADVESVATVIGLAYDAARTYLLVLERQGRVAVRLESFAEADARMARQPRGVFIRPKRRRRLRYAVRLSPAEATA